MLLPVGSGKAALSASGPVVTGLVVTDDSGPVMTAVR